LKHIYAAAKKTNAPDRCHNLEKKIMKIPHYLTKMIAVVAALLMLGASHASAIVIDWVPVGIAFGQTARANILNTSDRAIIMIGGRFVDSDGSVLGEFRGSIDPGKIMSFDLNRDTLPRPENRVQIHVVIEGPEPHLRKAGMSLEVFNIADGKTTAFIGDPGL
jgi:hypothetical protein